MILWTILAIVAILFGLLACLLTFVFLAASAPNSTPEYITRLKRVMWSSFAVHAAGTGAAIIVLINHLAARAVILALAPILVDVALLAWLFRVEAARKNDRLDGW